MVQGFTSFPRIKSRISGGRSKAAVAMMSGSGGNRATYGLRV